MNGDENQAYYAERARQERQRATACRDGSVANIHLKLADAYEQRAGSLAAPESD